MKILTLVALFILGFTVNAQNSHNRGHNDSIVRCSSIKNHRKTCRADTSSGVRLVRQLSRSSCHENWGYTHDSIWVDHGCRAEFQLYVNQNNGGNHNNNGYNNSGNHNNNNGYNNSGNHNNNNAYNNNGNHNNNGYNNGNASHGSLILCESINSHQASCPIPHDSRVTFSRQVSHSSCERNWGFNENSIWVTNGCRAEFTVSPKH